jgi:hypothetical protein
MDFVENNRVNTAIKRLYDDTIIRRKFLVGLELSSSL